MRTLIACLTFAIATTGAVSTVAAGGKSKPAPKADQWVDGTVSYKFAGVDPHFATPEEACKAGVEDLAKHGNKKSFDSVKEGTSSTMMTCMLKESDGSAFEQANVITKILECPATTTARSTDNSGEFSKMRCHCDDAKAGCPKTAAAAKPTAKK